MKHESAKDRTVSAIVCFYNEETSIGRVVVTLLASPLVSEVICVNDGSTDKSREVLEKFDGKIRVVQFKENYGKGRAMAAGIKEARGRFLLFCDADLAGFTVYHIKQMVEPVVSGKARAVFAVPTQDKKGRYSKHEVFLAGERVYARADLLPHVSKLSRTKGAGGGEIYLNTLFMKKDIRVVPLIGLEKPSKERKWSPSIAIKQYILSTIGVLQETGRIEINSFHDLKQLENLLQVDTMETLIQKIHEIKNNNVRKLLERYYTKYLAKYINKIKP